MQAINVTNLTDYPDKETMILDIYNGSLAPGETAGIAFDLIDEKMLELFKHGFIAIGELPVYYRQWKYPAQLTQADLIQQERELEKLKEEELANQLAEEALNKKKTKKKEE
jgi:hypothetical protein